MAQGSPEAKACSQQTVASRSACRRSVSTQDLGTDAMGLADRAAEPERWAAATASSTTRRASSCPPDPEQDVAHSAGQGLGVLAAVGLDPGELDGSLELGERTLAGSRRG